VLDFGHFLPLTVALLGAATVPPGPLTFSAIDASVTIRRRPMVVKNGMMQVRTRACPTGTIHRHARGHKNQ
jgi:hypothetical protein